MSEGLLVLNLVKQGLILPFLQLLWTPREWPLKWWGLQKDNKVRLATQMLSSKHTFLGLPREVRDIIYRYVFAGAQLTIEQEPHRPAQTSKTHIYRNTSFSMQLLHLCRQIHHEAFSMLAAETTLLLLPGVRNPDDAVKSVPSKWLTQIRTVHNNARIRSRITHVLRQRHLDPALFANLCTYRVAHIVYPDWRDSCHKVEDIESFVQLHLESEFFFQAGTLKLFTRGRKYALTTTLWLLRAYVEESPGWEIDFSLDSWTILRRRKAKFVRQKEALATLWDDPKCRDYRNYDIEYINE